MDKKKQSIIGIVVGTVILILYGWYNTNTKLKLAEAAATEVCECLERGNSNDIVGNVSADACINLLNNDGFRAVSKTPLENALQEKCPELSKEIQIVEKSLFD